MLENRIFTFFSKHPTTDCLGNMRPYSEEMSKLSLEPGDQAGLLVPGMSLLLRCSKKLITSPMVCSCQEDWRSGEYCSLKYSSDVTTSWGV